MVTANSHPLHLIISERLRHQILTGQYAAGEQLPSEHQLIEQFAVSRITVRHAIANLVQQGLVESRRGRGVFVKAQNKAVRSLSNPLIFFDADMEHQGIRASIRSLSFERVCPPQTVCEKLRLTIPADPVYCQKKVILTDDIPVAVDITYIRFDIGRVEATLECTHATVELSEALEIALGTPLLVNCYTAFTEHNQPIICGETLSRGDRLLILLS